MTDENAMTIKFKGAEKWKQIWCLLWLGEIRLWINDVQRIKFTMLAEKLERDNPKAVSRA